MARLELAIDRNNWDEPLYIKNPYLDNEHYSKKQEWLKIITEDILNEEVEAFRTNIHEDMIAANSIVNVLEYSITNNIDELQNQINNILFEIEKLKSHTRTDTENQKSLHEILRAKYNNELIPLKKID